MIGINTQGIMRRAENLVFDNKKKNNKHQSDEVSYELIQNNNRERGRRCNMQNRLYRIKV